MRLRSSDLTRGSFPLLRVARIPVRMHWLLAVSIAIEILRELHDFGARGALFAAISSVILVAVILVHELSHCAMAIRHGGRAEGILLWPLGGLAFVDHPRGTRRDVEVSAAGPLSNFAMAILAAVALIATGAAWRWEYLSPFSTWYPSTLSVPQWFVLHALRINVVLGLFNCIPAFPLDGGMIAHAILTARIGRVRATVFSSVSGMVFGGAFLAWGFVQGEVMLAMVGLWMILQARALGKTAEQAAGEEASSRGPRRSGVFTRWKAYWTRRAQRRDAARILRILDKVEVEGVGSLRDDERSLLRRRR